MAAAANDRAGFIFGPLHPLRAASMNVDDQISPLAVFAIVFQKCPNRNVDEVVLRLPEDGSKRLGYADHEIAAAIDVNRFSDGIDGGEQLSGDLLSDKSDIRSAVIIGIGDVAPGLHFLDIHIGDIGGDAADINVVQRLGSEADLAAGTRFQANRAGQFHAIAQSLEVFPGDIPVAAHRFQEVLLIGDDGEAKHEKDI